MRQLPPALSAHLDGGATTLCRCWRLVRKDGARFGFTDHDRDLAFDETIFAAATGLSASEAEAQLGMAVATGEVTGALMAAKITEADIAAGLYDDAEVTTFLANWADVTQRIVLDVSSVGEIRRSDGSFVAELRGPMHRFDQEQGRLYTRNCSANLGDAHCRVSLTPHTYVAPISTIEDALTLRFDALAGAAAGRFTGGQIRFNSGPNSGHARLIRHHAPNGLISLWEPLPGPVTPLDEATLIAGCDKTFATCRTTYANAANFRGFPDIPTSDFILTYARPGEGGHDGGTLDP